MNIQKSDYYILDILWENGDMKASQIANILEKNIGWNKNTTYTIINRCVKKEYIKRIDPGYVCRAMITKKQATESNVDELKKMINSTVMIKKEKHITTILVLSNKPKWNNSSCIHT